MLRDPGGLAQIGTTIDLFDQFNTRNDFQGRRAWPADEPHPSIVVREELADGTDVEVIWAWLPESRRAMLVTVYFPE